MRVVVKDGRREAERLESPPLGWYRRELRTWTTALPLLPLLLVLSPRVCSPLLEGHLSVAPRLHQQMMPGALCVQPGGGCQG